jgi:putative photosynthetic complex assembly protein
MTTDTRRQPKLRYSKPDMIPKVLLRAMLALPLAALAIVGANAVSGRPQVGVPHAAEVVQERSLVLEGRGAKAVALRDADGTLLAEMENGGFITVVQNGLQRARLVQGVDQALPVRLVRFDNGRLSLIDDASGWSVELHAFGDLNQAAFDRLLTE